jgi:hypothetical protein
MSERVTGLGPGSEVTDAANPELLPVAFEDLVAWYPFRSGTGEDLTAGDSRFGDTTDYSATVNGATFKPSGGVTDIQTGANSGAFDFDGTDDEANVGGGLSFGGREQFSLSFWFAPDTSGNRRKRIVCQGSGGKSNSNASLAVLEFDNNTFAVEAYDPSGNVTASNPVSGSNTTTGQFSLVTVTFDRGTILIYQGDSQNDSLNTGSTTLQDPTAGVSFGYDKPDNAAFFDGRIDGVRLYNKVLSPSEITQRFNNTKP